jgi:hypothetical protein
MVLTKGGAHDRAVHPLARRREAGVGRASVSATDVDVQIRSGFEGCGGARVRVASTSPARRG